MATLSSVDPSRREDNDPLARCFQELVRYYRHSSVGQRCLGIVHQMNTPLQVLAFHLELLEQKSREEWEILAAAPQPEADRLVQLAQYRQNKLPQFRQVVEQLQNLNRCLVLQGAHEDTQEQLYWDLNQIWRDELELYQAQGFFKHQVTKNFHFQEGLPLRYGHYLDFSQSFRNLIDNALEAMAGVENQELTVVTTFAENHLMLRIGDTGTGIPADNLPRIFEAFFTTKENRAGLGLFMVRRLLAPYQAQVEVESKPGRTWVTVGLP